MPAIKPIVKMRHSLTVQFPLSLQGDLESIIYKAISRRREEGAGTDFVLRDISFTMKSPEEASDFAVKLHKAIPAKFKKVQTILYSTSENGEDYSFHRILRSGKRIKYDPSKR